MSRKRGRVVALLCAVVLLLAATPAYSAVAGAKVGASPVKPWSWGFFDNDFYEYFDGATVPFDNTWQGAWYGTWGTGAGGTSYLHSLETSEPTNVGGWFGIPYDEDWRWVEVTAGHLYTIWATPVGPVTGADPVLELFTHDGVTTDPPGTDYSRWSDDQNWVSGGTGAMIQYHAPLTETLYVRCYDPKGSGVQLVILPGGLMSFKKRGVTYELHLLDHGVTPSPFVTRPAAPDRWTLAANLARQSLESGIGSIQHVIICCGQDSAAADSLVSAGLAGVYNAPVLLTDKTKSYLPAATKSVIQQIDTANGATKLKFHIVGGPASVPDGMIAQLKAAAPGASVDRLGGADRYAVAANVAARMRSVLGASYPKTALFVNGHDAAYFWDAMMAGPIAVRMHFPILLTHKYAVPSATSAAKAFYTGPKFAIGEAQSMGAAVPGLVGATRIDDGIDTAHYNRQSLARYVAEYAENEMWIGAAAGTASEVGLTNRLADSLVGGTFMGFHNGPLLFARSTETLDEWDTTAGGPTTAEYLMEHAYTMQDVGGGVWLFGGTASMWTDVEMAVASHIGVID